MMKLVIVILLSLTLNSTMAHAQAMKDINTMLKDALHYLESDLDKAEHIILKALDRDPNNHEANYLCGRIMGKQAENSFLSAFSYAKHSLSCLKNAVKQQPANVNYRTALLSFYLGAPSIAGGDRDRALEQVKAIHSINPVKGAKAEIKYLRETEQSDLLKEKLIAWVKQYPKNNEFYYRLGLIYQEEKHYQKAFEAFNQASNYKDEQVFYLNSLYQVGRNAVFSQLNIEAGIDALQVFLQETIKGGAAPSIEWAALRLAQLYNLIGKDEMKSKYYRLASKSSDRELHRILKKIGKA